jgi:hypothetical protein
MTSHTHQTAPTQFVNANGIRDANHGSLYQHSERFVTHVVQFLSESDEHA